MDHTQKPEKQNALEVLKNKYAGILEWHQELQHNKTRIKENINKRVLKNTKLSKLLIKSIFQLC